MKENTEKSVECKTSSSNPVGSVGMEFLIDGKKQRYNKRQDIEKLDANYGMVKSFTFTFTTNRSQNGKAAKCRLLWEGKYVDIEKKENLNITCKLSALQLQT